MKLALVKNGVFTGEMGKFDTVPDPNPAKGLEWLPDETDPDPSFDPETHKLSRVVDTVIPGVEVRHSREAVVLTSQEISDRAAAELVRFDIEDINAIWDILSVLENNHGFVNATLSKTTRDRIARRDALKGKVIP